MSVFKKLDDYLLHYYPTIWITRIHSFFPVGLGIALFLFLATVLTGWSPDEKLPENITAVVLMIIPVLIYLVYWFIFQSRYNVAKSGGYMPLRYEYLNFFSYLLVFLMAFLIISAIPLGNYQKVRNAIDEEVLVQDIAKLNLGNTLVSGEAEISFYPDESITYTISSFVSHNYFNRNFQFDYENGQIVTVSLNKAKEIIADYIEAFNKYTPSKIRHTPEEILADRQLGIADPDHYIIDGYGSDWDVKHKIRHFARGFEQGWYYEFGKLWFWQTALGFMAFLVLLVWIFKQMNLRQFIFGFIALCLTPLFFAIIGVILFEILDIRENEAGITSGLILFLYVFFTIIIIRAFNATTLNKTGYVLAMYLQFFLPFLPAFIWYFFFYNDDIHYYNRSDDLITFFYWTGWFIGLASIALFKPIYAKFRSLPSKN